LIAGEKPPFVIPKQGLALVQLPLSGTVIANAVEETALKATIAAKRPDATIVIFIGIPPFPHPELPMRQNSASRSIYVALLPQVA
jgi:hypothetical protein